MTTDTVSEFLTMDVADLPPRARLPKATGFAAAFRGLPEGKAIFFPQKEERLVVTHSRATAGVAAVAKALGRRVRSRADRDRGGVWVWWEAR